MRVAVVGCGFVADYYIRTIAAHPELQIVGVTDRNHERLDKFTRYYSLPAYRSLDELLDDPSVELVLNLTNPRSHFEVSQRSLLAHKHVYSEKPLAMKFEEAKQLVELAEQNGLLISSAPCSILGETAQTVWKALRENRVGQVRLVYAEMDDGMVHRMQYKRWLSESGAPWPYQDEFEVGCTLEHAGYYLTWLVAFFGPAISATAFSSCLIPDKETAQPLEQNAADFSVACIKFASGVVARLTCSIVAPHDHKLTMVGDEGILYTKEGWNFRSPVFTRRLHTVRRRTFLSPWPRRCPLLRSGRSAKPATKGVQRIDFACGVAEMAQALREGRACRLSPRFSLHVNELALAIQNAGETSAAYTMKSSCDPIEPMSWAT